MTYFEIWHAVDSSIVEIDDHYSIPLFTGDRFRDSWPLLGGRLGGAVTTDFAYLGPGVLVSKRSSWLQITDRLPAVRFEAEPLRLRLVNSTEPYVALNVVNVRRCLDVENSVVQYIPGSRRLMRVLCYRFVPEAVGHSTLFKVPELVRTSLFCTDALRQLTVDLGLTGLRFVELPLV